MAQRPWQEIAKEAQHERDSSIARVIPLIPKVPDELPLDVTHLPGTLLSAEEVKITETPPEELVGLLAKGTYSAKGVTSAFLRRAGVAQKLTNCVTEMLPEKAAARAEYLDEYYRKHGQPIGPLHGLPISVKEHIAMEGLRHTCAFVSWWEQRAPNDAPILEILWKAGCVFYVRTTEPQSLMHLETSNNLYGITVNPFNRNLTSGGSSGGEGALLGLRGSCLGLGTDIGGSIRAPSANCGLYGLKPTTYRVPWAGLAVPMMGEEHVVPVLGPLSTSVEGIKMFMKVALADKPWLKEPWLVPIPWRDEEHFPNSRIKIAVMWHDGIVKPHPPVLRALQTVVDKLKTVPGVEMVDWKPEKHNEAWRIVSSLYFADGGRDVGKVIKASGEPWRPLTHFIVKENPHVKDRIISEVWDLTVQREAYRAMYANHWNGTAAEDGQMVDVILCPAGPGVAPLLDQSRYWGYTSLWNLLDYPAMIFPVTKMDPTLDLPETDFQPMSKEDQENNARYQDPAAYRGAPVSLQLVGRRYEDEKASSCFLQPSITLTEAGCTSYGNHTKAPWHACVVTLRGASKSGSELDCHNKSIQRPVMARTQGNDSYTAMVHR